MSENIIFLNYFMSKFRLSNDDLASFLFIDKRTLYNYKNLDIKKLPKKVKEKFILFFQGYNDFYKQELSMKDIYDLLQDIDNKLLEYTRGKFLEIAQIRKNNYIITSTNELLKKNDVKRDVNSLTEFLTDFKILIEYSNLTKGYLYSLFEIIINKLDNENDYSFLDYINNYQKESK